MIWTARTDDSGGELLINFKEHGRLLRPRELLQMNILDLEIDGNGEGKTDFLFFVWSIVQV